jgi:hypothetical protein
MSYIGRTPTNAALTAADLADGIVSTDKIAADAVTDAKIADDVVGTEHLTANEVDTTALGADAVTGAQLADDAVNSEHYTDGSIDTAHIADGQVTTAKLATAVFTGATDIGAAIVDADLFLMDDGAGGTIRKTTASRLKTYASAANTPAFSAKSNAATSMSANTDTLINYAAEDFDSDGTFASSRFTPGVAGKYYIEGRYRISETGDFTGLKIAIFKNGSAVRVHQQSNFNNETVSINGILDLDDNDYVEIYGTHNHSGSSGTVNDDAYNRFIGFRIIT